MNKDDFFHTGFRPALAWIYCIVCLFDFTIMPILFNILQFNTSGQNISDYSAISLQGSGIFHLSMAGILSINSHSKSKERIASLTTPSL